MEWEQEDMEDKVREELNVLVQQLKTKEEILRYKVAERAVEENDWIQETVEKIKHKQKELVNFQYYDKPQAFQEVKRELDQLNAELEGNISVEAYRNALWEANEIVQLLFQRLQTAVDEETHSDREQQ